jgi:flagellar protein FliO/FliZ
MKPRTLIRGAAFAGALTLLHAPIALAVYHGPGEKTPLHLTSTTAKHASSSGAAGSIVRTVVGLAIVIAVIYGLSWIMRQAKAAKNPATGTGLTQIASLPLGPNRSVSLVRVGTELHLLGIAEQGVTKIRTFTEDEAVAAGLPVLAPGETVDGTSTPPVTKAIDALRRITIR